MIWFIRQCRSLRLITSVFLFISVFMLSLFLSVLYHRNFRNTTTNRLQCIYNAVTFFGQLLHFVIYQKPGHSADFKISVLRHSGQGLCPCAGRGRAAPAPSAKTRVSAGSTGLSYCQHAAAADPQYQYLLLAAGDGVEVNEDIFALCAGAAHLIAEDLVFAA